MVRCVWGVREIIVLGRVYASMNSPPKNSIEIQCMEVGVRSGNEMFVGSDVSHPSIR